MKTKAWRKSRGKQLDEMLVMLYVFQMMADGVVLELLLACSAGMDHDYHLI
jgi:hypothetical protein